MKSGSNFYRANQKRIIFKAVFGKIRKVLIRKKTAKYLRTICQLSANYPRTSCKLPANCLQNIRPKLSAKSLREVRRAAARCAAARCPQSSRPPQHPRTSANASKKKYQHAVYKYPPTTCERPRRHRKKKKYPRKHPLAKDPPTTRPPSSSCPPRAPGSG